MNKLNLRKTKRIKSAAGELKALKGPEFSWQKVVVPLTDQVRALFSASNNGALHYLTHDFAGLYQDNLGKTPVTAVEQPVGLLLDRRFDLERGPELASDYLQETHWQISGLSGGGSLNITLDEEENLLTLVRGTITTRASFQFPTTVGKYYEITFKQINSTSNTSYFFSVNPGTSDGVSTGTIASGYSGSLRLIARATSAYSYFIVNPATSDPDVTVSFTDLSIKEIPGNHAFQITPASRPKLSARVNQLIASNSMTAGSGYLFVRQGATFTDGQPGPYGANDALLVECPYIEDTGQSSSTRIYARAKKNQLIGDQLVTSVHAKLIQGTGVYLALSADTSAGAAAYFDLSTGEVARVTGGANAGCEYVGDGFYRYWFAHTANIDDTGPNHFVWFCNRTTSTSFDPPSNGTEKIVIWGMQVENGLTPTKYQWVNTDTDYDWNNWPLYLDFDNVDDVLDTTFQNLGNECVIASSAPTDDVQVLIEQTIPVGQYSFNSNFHASAIIDRDLTESETIVLTDWLHEKARVAKDPTSLALIKRIRDEVFEDDDVGVLGYPNEFYLQRKLGPELSIFSDGFKSSIGLSLGAGWSVADGKLIAQSPTGNAILTSLPLVIGKTYEIEYKVGEYTSGTVSTGGGTGNGFANTGVGVFRDVRTATASTIFGFLPAGVPNLKISRVSVREVLVDNPTMFQDNDCKVPVTSIEQPVGTMFDTSLNLKAGSDEFFVVDDQYIGEFSNLLNVSALNQGNLGRNDQPGTYYYDAVTNSLSVESVIGQYYGWVGADLTNLISGNYYIVEFTVVSATVATHKPYVAINETALDADEITHCEWVASPSARTYKFVFRARDTNIIRFYSGGQNAVVKYRNVKIRSLSGNHLIQQNETKKPKLSARVNLFPKSNIINWTSVTAMTRIPMAEYLPEYDSYLAAYYETEVSSNHSTKNDPGGKVTYYDGMHIDLSFLVRSIGGRNLRLTGPNLNVINLNVIFDLTNGTILYKSPDTEATIERVDGDLYRCTVRIIAKGTGTVISFTSIDGVTTTFMGDPSKGFMLGAPDFRVYDPQSKLPLYQRVVSDTDYDWKGWPLYLAFDGTDDQINALNFGDLNQTTPTTFAVAQTFYTGSNNSGCIAMLASPLDASAIGVSQAPYVTYQNGENAIFDPELPNTGNKQRVVLEAMSQSEDGRMDLKGIRHDVHSPSPSNTRKSPRLLLLGVDKLLSPSFAKIDVHAILLLNKSINESNRRLIRGWLKQSVSMQKQIDPKSF